MNKYLVTGAMGFVGSHWCQFLLEKGKTVYGMDLGPRYSKLLEYENFIFVQDTIKNLTLVKTLIDQVDCICHFAGIAQPDQYVKFPRKVIDITAKVGMQIIDMCRYTGKLFFYTSTSEIYGKSNKIPFKEDDDRVLGSTRKKRWCYSTSKAILEHYLDACQFSGELNYIIVRLFNVYGPRLEGRVVSKFLDNLIKGKDLVIHGEGNQTRSFTYIDDVVEAFELLINNLDCLNQIFNIGNPKETSIKELAGIINTIGKSSKKPKFIQHSQYFGKSYEDINRRIPDISKIKKFSGWEPKTSLEEGLTKMIEYGKTELNTK